MTARTPAPPQHPWLLPPPADRQGPPLPPPASNWWCCGTCHPWFCAPCQGWHCNWFTPTCPRSSKEAK